MKTIKREFSSLLSIMITAMLVLGMMSGMLTLSASADGDNLPEVIGDAVLKYYDRFYYKAAYDVQGYSYEVYSSEYGYFVPEIDIVLQMNNTNSQGTAHDLNSNSYGYYDYSCYLHYVDNYEGVNEEAYCQFEYASDFDLLLASPNYLFDTLKYSYDIDESNLTSSIKRADLELIIEYSDGTRQVVPITKKFEVDRNNTQLYLGDHTSGALLLSLAHSKTINDQSFYQLENAIFNVRNVNEDTTRRHN